MPDRILRTTPIWMFGKRFDFNIYEVVDAAGNRVALNNVQRQLDQQGNPVRKQKNQIVLHFTAGNSAASGTLGWFNTMAQRPNFFCNHWSNAHQAGGPNAGVCPITPAHGQMRSNKGAAHYVLELAQDRLTPAAQAYSDVVELVDSDTVCWHGGPTNENAIGIEHANVGDAWGGAQHEVMTPGANSRPVNHNRYLHSTQTWPDVLNNLNNVADYQAYQEEQYLAMILLLRYLCIKHRIPRRWLGETPEEKFQRYWSFPPQKPLPPAEVQPRQSRLMRYRGILSHANCHKDKTCPGPAMHRNRLFRGIIDEWWLPVEFDGNERPYYHGPFDPQPNAGAVQTPSYFRFAGGALQQEVFRDANLEALQETRSYYDLDHQELYYAQTERPVQGGTYPIGNNRIWHGGVHLQPGDANRKVYAAASGTIVAARLGSDAITENDPGYGSQRFVLIRHCVYTETEADPGGGQRTNFTPDPTYIFTLYMHLAPFSQPLDAVHNENPPWFNGWIRHRAAAADPNVVFCPMVEVSVGDWLGECGQFAGAPALHFEVISRTELTMAPWDSANHRFHDPNANAICDIASLSNFVTDAAGDGIDLIDILRAARELRRVKAYHKSEWALSGPDALVDVIPNAATRQDLWQNRIRHFMWVADAVAACPDLSAQLTDAQGLMWHYHPITFMEFVNRRIVQENGQVSEPDATNTNVTLEDGYLTRYVSFVGAVAQPAAADTQHVRPFDVSSNNFEYVFTRAELACHGAAPHDPPDDPPTATRFHLSLLDFLESVRRIYGQGIAVNLAHLCAGHNTAANDALCVIGTGASRQSHAEGHAIDIKPTNANPARCRQLWEAINSVSATYEANCGEHGGEPSRADMPEGLCDIQVLAPPAILAKLNAGTALSPTEAGQCIFHLELRRQTHTVVWDCVLKTNSRAWQVSLTMVGARFDLVAFYNSQADAEAERPPLNDPVRGQGSIWECSLRQATSAVEVRIDNSNIIASYANVVDAEMEKSPGTSPSPRET